MKPDATSLTVQLEADPTRAYVAVSRFHEDAAESLAVVMSQHWQQARRAARQAGCECDWKLWKVFHDTGCVMYRGGTASSDSSAVS